MEPSVNLFIIQTQFVFFSVVAADVVDVVVVVQKMNNNVIIKLWIRNEMTIDVRGMRIIT